MVNMGELFAHSRIHNLKMDRVLVSQTEQAFTLEEGDLLFARQSLVFEGAGKCSIFLGGTESTVFESHIIRCRLDRAKADSVFYFYFFQSPLGRDAISAIVEQGAGAAGIRGSDLAKLPVHVPHIAVQKAIAYLLGSLDSKIASLRQVNGSLEAIARAIFKSWFVDFDPVRAKAEGREPEGMDAATAALFADQLEDTDGACVPKGWHPDGLGRVCQAVRDTVQAQEIRPDENYVGLEHIPRASWALSTWGKGIGLDSGKSRFVSRDVLFGKLRPYFHKVCLAPVCGVCSTDILVIRAEIAWRPFVLCHLSSVALIEYATRLSNGAKMPRTRWQDLASYKVAVPPSSLAVAFAAIVQPMLDSIISNVEQVCTLTQLRDTLLPRLISGKLRVPEAEKLVEAVL